MRSIVFHCLSFTLFLLVPPAAQAMDGHPDIGAFRAPELTVHLGQPVGELAADTWTRGFEQDSGDYALVRQGNATVSIDGRDYSAGVTLLIQADQIAGIDITFDAAEVSLQTARSWAAVTGAFLDEWLRLPDRTGWIDNDGDIMIVSTEYGSDDGQYTQILLGRPVDGAGPEDFACWYDSVVNSG
jgi:hypothetical protein